MSASEYFSNTQRCGFLGHLSFGVRSYEVSKAFYTPLLKTFGLELVYDNPVRGVLGYGFDPDHEIFNVFERGDEAHPPGAGTHFAFNAPNRKCVREFWEAGMQKGGKDEGRPGIRKDYGKNYYAAFVFDPDGFKLEAVFQEESSEEKSER